MTSFRLDSYRDGDLVSSEVVDGLDNDDLAVKLVLSDCTSGYCKLYRDDVVIAEMDRGVWSLPVPPREVPNHSYLTHLSLALALGRELTHT